MHWNINRITVEFKTRYNEETDEVEYNINRITVEFKTRKAPVKLWLSCILIESQWNLKFDDWHECPTCRQILIESQWNLKVKPGSRKNCRVRHINRITVEFKKYEADKQAWEHKILIESQWNLKVNKPCPHG